MFKEGDIRDRLLQDRKKGQKKNCSQAGDPQQLLVLSKIAVIVDRQGLSTELQTKMSRMVQIISFTK